jgi:uncharacterized membrane protein YdjX (TVP38/TMEM64 family)
MGVEDLPVRPEGDPWPQDMPPDFTDVDVGISRTQPRCGDEPPVHEAEALFFDSIDAAERRIYIENQFIMSAPIARRLARRLRRRRELEVVIVAPRRYDSWVESRSMRNARIRFMRTLRRAGGDRVQLLYPAVADDKHSTDTMIHSKVMVVDDRLLRVGSANLNNRSMGADTECDLAIEGKSARERQAIADVRNRLLGEHCGVGASEVAKAIKRGGSLIAAATSLSERGHRLRPIDDGEPDESQLSVALEEIADPYEPPSLRAVAGSLFNRLRPKFDGTGLAVLAAIALVAVLTLAWSYTPLSQIADPDTVRGLFKGAAREPWAPLLVLAVFVAAGLVAFPVIVLIAATGAVFGPWLGFVYALIGVLTSALVTFVIGARYGQRPLRRMIGPRLERIRRQIERKGVVAVAAIRVVPIAPFTIVNLVAGASAIRLLDFVAGTLLGMIPGLVVLSMLGSQIVRVLSDPAPFEIALLAGAIVAWIALSFGVQALVSRLWRPS